MNHLLYVYAKEQKIDSRLSSKFLNSCIMSHKNRTIFLKETEDYEKQNANSNTQTQ